MLLPRAAETEKHRRLSLAVLGKVHLMTVDHDPKQ